MKPEEVERSFSADQCILEHGASVRELYIVRSGTVRIEARDGRVARRLAGGAVFGEISAILGQASPYCAIADDDAVVLVLDLPLLNRMCRESAEFSMRMIRHLASEWMREIDGSGESGGDTATLAGVLLRRQVSQGSGPVADCLAELAAEARLPMVVAYRALHELLDRGWVQLTEDQLTVVSPESLEALIS